jgi:hypothetical protein
MSIWFGKLHTKGKSLKWELLVDINFVLWFEGELVEGKCTIIVVSYGMPLIGVVMYRLAEFPWGAWSYPTLCNQKQSPSLIAPSWYYLVEERGVLALGCICTLYFKRSLNIFWISKKIQKNLLCAVFHNLYVTRVVSRKTDSSCELEKKG